MTTAYAYVDYGVELSDMPFTEHSARLARMYECELRPAGEAADRSALFVAASLQTVRAFQGAARLRSTWIEDDWRDALAGACRAIAPQIERCIPDWLLVVAVV